MKSLAECQINIVLAMSYFCSFPPKFTFPGCSEEFLFPSIKIQNIYYIDNQLVIFKSISRLSLFNTLTINLLGKF